MKKVFLMFLLPLCVGLMGMESCFPGDGADVDSSGNDAFGTPDHGPALSYTDNGDGTVMDNNTKFIWEVKLAADGSDGGNCQDVTQANRSVHCENNTYTWTDTGDGDNTDPDGTLFTEFLAELNNSAFAGSSGWCIPNVKRLQSIVDYGEDDPAIDPSFPGATQSSFYWSSTTQAPLSTNFAWRVNFDGGNVVVVSKIGNGNARAVRPCS